MAGLLGIEELDRADIEAILGRAKDFQASTPRDSLRGKLILNLFSGTSFETAAKRLGAEVVSREQSLVDTVSTFAAMRPDAIVVGHPASGAAHFLARRLPIPIINAGDGMHENPAQALADARAILDRRPKLDGLRVAIIGDIAYSGAARSNAHLFSKFGGEVVLCGPAPLLPADLQGIAPGITLAHDIGKAIEGADVIITLDVQLDRRHETPFPADDYSRFYELRTDLLALARPDVIVLNAEKSDEVRMAALEWTISGATLN